MMGDDIHRMDIKEFREVGYLQELNRQFLHPLGLALEVFVNDDGTERLGGVWDYRDDPEGMNYTTITPDHEARALRVLQLSQLRHEGRLNGVGYWIQPAGIRDEDKVGPIEDAELPERAPEVVAVTSTEVC